MNIETKEYSTVNLGEFVLSTTKIYSNFQLIALAKKKYPELTKHKNIQLLTKVRKNVIIVLPLTEVITLFPEELDKGEK